MWNDYRYSDLRIAVDLKRALPKIIAKEYMNEIYNVYSTFSRPSTDGTVLENVESIKYLGVTITDDLKWNTNIINICTKANRTLGFLRRIFTIVPKI